MQVYQPVVKCVGWIQRHYRSTLDWLTSNTFCACEQTMTHKSFCQSELKMICVDIGGAAAQAAWSMLLDYYFFRDQKGSGAARLRHVRGQSHWMARTLENNQDEGTIKRLTMEVFQTATPDCNLVLKRELGVWFFCWFCGFQSIFSWRVIASSLFLWTRQVPISITRIPWNGGDMWLHTEVHSYIYIYAWIIDRMADCSWRRPHSCCQDVVQAKYAGISLGTILTPPDLTTSDA